MIQFPTLHSEILAIKMKCDIVFFSISFCSFFNNIFHSFSIIEFKIIQVFCVFFPLYALLSGFLYTTYFLLRSCLSICCAGYMFCFYFMSSCTAI